MQSFVDRQGHMGAFVGSMADVTHNVNTLAKHLGLAGDERDEFAADVMGWIGADWRSKRSAR